MPDPAPSVRVERRGPVVLIGIDRPDADNRIDPSTFVQLATAYHDYEQDPSLRAAVLYGHGPHFSAGLDVAAFAPVLASGTFDPFVPGMINPLQTTRPRLTKPVVGVAHGHTFFMGHELFLATDVRVAAENTVFSQAENTRAVFPGGGATVRFPAEAGWAVAMRYMLTGDTWSAREAQRMSLLIDVAPDQESALELGISLAHRIAAAAPLSTRATLASAHTAVDDARQGAFDALLPAFGELLRTEDFAERRRSLDHQRTPEYRGR